MPLLSKRAFALPNKNKSPFKKPTLTKENIEKILNTGNETVSKKGKFDNDNISNSSSSKSRQHKNKTISKSVSLTLSIEQTDSQTSKKKNDIDTPPSSLNQSASKFDRSIDELFDDTPNDVSQVVSILTEEVISRPEVRELYLKHWDETFPKELEDDFRQFSQEYENLHTKKHKKKVKSDNSKTKQKKEPTKKKATTKKEVSTKKKASQKKMFENLLNEKNKYVLKHNEKNDSAEGSGEKERSKKTVGEIKKTISKENTIETVEELYERMMKIQELRNVGLYVYCDSCNKVRYLPDTKDPLDLPHKWYCEMNPDKEHNKCTDPEEVIEEDEEFLIHNLYNAGSIVWARMDGYPWWPAMVEDDPDTETYFWLEGNSLEPTWYHVTFFDSSEVSRAWMRPLHLKPFEANMKNPEVKGEKTGRYKTRLSVAVKKAMDACALPLLERLRTYSFIKLYKKPLLNKKTNLSKNSTTKNGNKKIEKKRRRVIRIDSLEDSYNDLDEIPVDADKLLENLTSNDIINLFS